MATPDEIRALANLVEQLADVTCGCAHALPDHEFKTVHDQLFEVLQTAQTRLLMYLAYSDDMLVGAEHCDECAEVMGTVVQIDREPDLMVVTNTGGFYLRDVYPGQYFRLPGSNAYGELALAELARARAEQAERQQPPILDHSSWPEDIQRCIR